MQDERDRQAALPSMDQLVDRTTGLASLPAVYFEVRRIIDNPDGSVIDLAKTIALDPALTSRLLRIVNSVVYGGSRPVETVSRAVYMLGMQQIHNLVLASCLHSTFARFRPRLLDLQAFWQGSVQRAVLAGLLAERIGLRDKERLFVLGLLSDLGRLVLWQHLPEAAEQALKTARERGEPLYLAESALFGYDHGQLGGALLAAWKLPSGIHQPIRAQGQAWEDQPYAREAAWLRVIGRVVEATERKLDPLTWIDPADWPRIGATAEDVLEAIREAEAEVARIRDIFLPG